VLIERNMFPAGEDGLSARTMPWGILNKIK